MSFIVHKLVCFFFENLDLESNVCRFSMHELVLKPGGEAYHGMHQPPFVEIHIITGDLGTPIGVRHVMIL